MVPLFFFFLKSSAHCLNGVHLVTTSLSLFISFGYNTVQIATKPVVLLTFWSVVFPPMTAVVYKRILVMLCGFQPVFAKNKLPLNGTCEGTSFCLCVLL